MKFLKANSFSLLILGLMAVLSLYFYPQLPERVATKFDFNGSPTQFSSREFVVGFLPTVYLFLIFFIRTMIQSSSEKFSMPNSRRAMEVIVAGTGLLFLGIQIGMLSDPSGKETFVRYFSFGIALFLIVVGNVFGKAERNFFMGIRVPWTLASETNWRATHRFCGKLMVTFGLVLLVLSFFYSSMPVAILALLVPTLTPIIYSYLFYKTEKQRSA